MTKNSQMLNRVMSGFLIAIGGAGLGIAAALYFFVHEFAYELSIIGIVFWALFIIGALARLVRAEYLPFPDSMFLKWIEYGCIYGGMLFLAVSLSVIMLRYN